VEGFGVGQYVSAAVQNVWFFIVYVFGCWRIREYYSIYNFDWRIIRMENVAPVIWSSLICCGGPVFFMFVGAWMAKGMPGSPLSVSWRGKRYDDSDYE